MLATALDQIKAHPFAFTGFVIAALVVVIAIRGVQKAEVGPRLARLLAVLLASFAFYSPAELFDEAGFVSRLVHEFRYALPRLFIMGLEAVAIIWCVVDIIRNYRAEVVGLKDAGTRFLVIAIAGVAARVFAGYLF